jgi:hypothetical protein
MLCAVPIRPIDLFYVILIARRRGWYSKLIFHPIASEATLMTSTHGKGVSNLQEKGRNK